MVLLAADGLRNDQIAARLDCGRDVVSQWRKRFFEQRLAGLEDLPRRGRPPTFPGLLTFPWVVRPLAALLVCSRW